MSNMNSGTLGGNTHGYGPMSNGLTQNHPAM